LFVLGIELLNLAIQMNSNIKGIKDGEEEIKTTLYADDTTLLLRDLHSVQTLLETLENFRACSGSWKRRKLTLLGKINIVKSLGLSKLIYNASVLSLPENFSIWDNKPHKIKTSTLIGDNNVGGLKMSEFETMNKASWVRRFNTEVDAPWKIIPNYMTRHLGGFNGSYYHAIIKPKNSIQTTFLVSIQKF